MVPRSGKKLGGKRAPTTDKNCSLAMVFPKGLLVRIPKNNTNHLDILQFSQDFNKNKTHSSPLDTGCGRDD